MIYVFRTTVSSSKDIKELETYIEGLFPQSKWNFDLEDCDKIFRIESNENIPKWIVYLFQIFDFECEELE